MVPVWLAKAGMTSWYLLGIIIVVSLLVFATLRVQIVLVAIFVALVLSSVLVPIVNALSKVMPRALALVLSVIAGLGFISGLLYYVVSSIVNQWENLAEEFQGGMAEILKFLEEGPLPFHVTQEEIITWVNQTAEQAIHYVQENAGNLASQVLSNAGNVTMLFIVFALSLFLTVYMVMRGDSLWLWFVNQLPSRARVDTHRAASAAWYTFSGYARGTVIIAIIVGILAFLLLFFTGVPLAAPLAVLVFIGAFIPLIGAPLAMIIATVVALAAQGWITALVIMLGIALIGQIEGHILQPLVMGKQVSLHPVVVAVGVTSGTILGGLVGAIVAIPLLAVVWTVYATLHTPDPPLEKLPNGRAPVVED